MTGEGSDAHDSIGHPIRNFANGLDAVNVLHEALQGTNAVGTMGNGMATKHDDAMALECIMLAYGNPLRPKSALHSSFLHSQPALERLTVQHNMAQHSSSLTMQDQNRG